jgi:5-methylcytosine-specific restriction endonuclease McrA
MLSSDPLSLTREEKRKAYSINVNSVRRLGQGRSSFVDPQTLALWLKDSQNQVCNYCGEPAEHTDHIIPLSKGGIHTLANLQRLCKYCNIAKSDQHEDDFLARVDRIARRSTGTRWRLFLASLLPKCYRDHSAEEKVLDAYGIPASLCGRLPPETRGMMFNNALRLMQTINQRPST